MDKYGRALNFIARRLGYNSAHIRRNLDGQCCVVMVSDASAAFVNLIDTTQLRTYMTYPDAKSAVRHMLTKKVKRNLWVLKGPKPYDPGLREYQPWLRVLKDEDTLDSLCIEGDISHEATGQDAS